MSETRAARDIRKSVSMSLHPLAVFSTEQQARRESMVHHLEFEAMPWDMGAGFWLVWWCDHTKAMKGLHADKFHAVILDEW